MCPKINDRNLSLIAAGERSVAKGAVSLNVGGTVHLVKWETIDKFPKSRLQKLRYATSEGEIRLLLLSFRR